MHRARTCHRLIRLLSEWRALHACFALPLEGAYANMQGSGMLLQLMYGSRTAEAISATNTMNQIRLAELFASTIAEHAGIVAASAIYSFGRVSGDTTVRTAVIIL